jgi:hypothetical protein
MERSVSARRLRDPTIRETTESALSIEPPSKGDIVVNYEPIAKARFEVERTPDGERIRINARRQIFAMLFLPLWLTVWTFGGVAAISQLATRFEPFLVLWLCGWAVGWVAASATLVWMVTGSETLRAVGGDLEYSHHALGRSRRWLYQGARIRRLRVANQPAWASRFSFQVPFLNVGRMGSIKFDYGPRTISVAQGLDDAEGQMIIDLLRKRLPATAV